MDQSGAGYITLIPWSPWIYHGKPPNPKGAAQERGVYVIVIPRSPGFITENHPIPRAQPEGEVWFSR